MNDNTEVIFDHKGSIGLITLNRPKALNALSLSMVKMIHAQLLNWERDNKIVAVVIQGAGDKTFCAGGDIRVLYNKRGTDYGQIYYTNEYLLNVTIFNFSKPFIALMDGVVMGGGAGVSVHGSHRIVTERTLFAMPETSIGLFPDVGASWFLLKCPGEIGMYLGLIGARLSAADCLYAKIADYYMKSDSLDLLINELSAISNQPGHIDDVICKYTDKVGLNNLSEKKETIDRCFSAESIEKIIENLKSEDDIWSKETIDSLNKMSPTSLKITFRQLRKARTIEAFENVVAMEYRMANRCFNGHDLFEGIRAVVVDKDRTPKWSPSKVDDISEEDIDEYFTQKSDEPDFYNY
ncbi:MAG: enoyl-CoA hydratase/isomerase family protein [Alphaproteobacteria bacterium]